MTNDFAVVFCLDDKHVWDAAVIEKARRNRQASDSCVTCPGPTFFRLLHVPKIKITINLVT